MALFKRKVAKVNRCRLSDSYIENMTVYLASAKNIPIEKARAFVLDVVKKKGKFPRIKIDETVEHGKIKTKIISFSQFLDKIAGRVITPSGSIYKSVAEEESIVTRMVGEFKKDRSKYKKKKFKAMEEGNDIEMRVNDAIQNSIKITLNSLPGGYGFPSSIFYDKGSYNCCYF